MLRVLKDAGRYNPNLTVQSQSDFGHIVARLKELLDKSDMEDFQNSYLRVSEGKSFDVSHTINMTHVLEALSSIINKNSGEQAIKKFLELRVLNDKGVSKQVDGYRRLAGDILPEKLSIKATCNCKGVAKDVVVQT